VAASNPLVKKLQDGSSHASQAIRTPDSGVEVSGMDTPISVGGSVGGGSTRSSSSMPVEGADDPVDDSDELGVTGGEAVGASTESVIVAVWGVESSSSSPQEATTRHAAAMTAR
jgi:hypothetical protein